MQDPLSNSIRILNSMAKILKRKRIENGALTLASPEVKFTRSEETQDPIDIDILPYIPANTVVKRPFSP